ncbi:MAG: cysteine desulfurase [Patescibacteria group bacterium]
MFSVDKIRQDFPQLGRKINGKPLVYLDSTATSLKPLGVIRKLEEYYSHYCANIFRGIYTLSEEATAEYEKAREKVAAFINAASREIIFTRNTTEAINLVAYSWGRVTLSSADEIATTIMEHHSNFVPWQQLAAENGLSLRVWNINEEGRLNTQELDKIITRKTKLLAITAVSNVLGTINPIKEIIHGVKRLNPWCLVLVDAAQAVPHMRVDVRDWGADFVAFSSHKMLGPTGVGVLWGRSELLEALSPFLFGGEMIREVRVEKTLFKEIPHKFEAGTPHIAGAIALGSAIEYLSGLGMAAVRNHEQEITRYALRSLQNLPGTTIYGPQKDHERGGVIAFTMKEAHPHDIAQVLNEDNICIRSGNHCAMPLHLFLGIGATARASFYVYTTKKDIDALITGLDKVKRLFS